jgi:teichuronic acid biosynthesis glycosyltransferase TuaC
MARTRANARRAQREQQPEHGSGRAGPQELPRHEARHHKGRGGRPLRRKIRQPVRVVVVAEWYPSPADPVHGVWAHRQALAARDAGAEVHVLALRRPVPPIEVVRRGGLGRWLADFPGSLKPAVIDGLQIDPVPLIAPPRPWSYGVWGHWAAPSLALALGRLSRSRPFDVLHAHSVTPTGFAAATARRWGRLAQFPALVVSTHGPDVISVHARSGAARRATESALRRADIVLANSSWAAQRCEQLAGRALETRVVHFGADVPASAPERHARPTIVTVAHLHARKRHALVLHALAELGPEARPDYVVIGEGRGREPLRQLAARLGLGEQVRFLGQLENQDALAESWRCHVYVMPSVEEPFGVAYVEAMAGGLPAIGTRGEGGPEDIAAAGGGMLLVPADDHRALAGELEQLLRDRRRLEDLGRAARENVERNFTWRACGEATIAAYRTAIQRSGR